MIPFPRVPLITLILLFPLAHLSAQPDNLPIETLDISGNEAYSDNQLRSLMKLNIVGFLSFRSRPFSRRALRIDAHTIQSFYASRGYLEATVVDSFAVNTGGRVEVYLMISEGRQFRLGGIIVMGNRLFTTERIKQFVGLETGEPYNPVLISNRLDDLRNLYKDRGNLTIDILEEREIGADENVYVRLSISEGITYTIGQIATVGLSKVPENYLSRELLFQPGDTFNQSNLIQSQQRVYESGLFSAVEIIPTVRASEPGIADIEVRVRELEQRSIDFTLGFRQKEAQGAGEPLPALTISGQWWRSRVLNTSIRSGITVETDLLLENIQSPEYQAAWEFLIPWTLGLRIPSSIKFFSSYRTWPDIVRKNGVEFAFLSKRLRRSQLRGSFGWVFIQAPPGVLDSVTATQDGLNLNDPGFAADSPNPLVTQGAERSFKLDYLFQDVDNLLAPRQGTIFQFKPSFHGTFIKEVSFYYKVEVDIRRYHPVMKQAVFAYRLKASYLETLPGGLARKLFYLDLFDLGGSTSLRGWSRPEKFSSERGVVKGLANAELRFPLIWILGGELFVDAGALYAFRGENDPALEWKKGWDVGAGLLISTPLGPIRIDAAVPQGIGGDAKPTYHVAFLYTF